MGVDGQAVGSSVTSLTSTTQTHTHAITTPQQPNLCYYGHRCDRRSGCRRIHPVGAETGRKAASIRFALCCLSFFGLFTSLPTLLPISSRPFTQPNTTYSFTSPFNQAHYTHSHQRSTKHNTMQHNTPKNTGGRRLHPSPPGPMPLR